MSTHICIGWLQVGVDITGEAVKRASRKVAAAYKQAADPLSDPLQQWQGLAEGQANPTQAPASKQLPSSQLFHGDIATANAMKPGKCASMYLPASSAFIPGCMCQIKIL